MILKKVNSMILIFILICSICIPIYAEDFTDVRADRDYLPALKLLSGLGIIEKSGTFLAYEAISRQEFIKMLNVAGALSLPETPDQQSLSYGEAVKVILDSLGYAPIAYVEGGHIRSYLMIAERENLSQGITLKQDDVLTRADTIMLISNAMSVYKIKEEGTGRKGTDYSQVYENWLYDVHRTTIIDGIITDRPYFTQQSSKIAVKFTDVFGREFTVKTNAEVESLLGYSITAYIKNIDDYAEIICAYETKNNNVLTINKSSYGGYESISEDGIDFYYYNNKGTKNLIKLRANANFVYNDTLKNELRGFKFKPSHTGDMKFVDFDNDNVYDYVFINNYREIYVESADSVSKKIVNKLRMLGSKYNSFDEILNVTLDEEDTNCKVIIQNSDFKKARFSDITQGCIVSVAVSNDASPDSSLVKKAIISHLAVTGTVTDVVTDENGDTCFILDGGKMYKPTKSYYNTFDFGDSINITSIKLGMSGTFYLNYDERIAYTSFVAIGSGYGVLIDAGYEEGLDPDMQYKIFTEKGETKVFKTNKKTFENLVKNNYVGMQITVDSNGKVVMIPSVPQIVKYEADGEMLTNIKGEKYSTPDYRENQFDSVMVEWSYDKNVRYNPQNSRLIHSSSLNTSYIIGNGTKIFFYNGNSTENDMKDEHNYDVISKDYLKKNVDYFAKCCDSTEEGSISALLIGQTSEKITTEFSAIDYADFMIVTGINEIIDNDGLQKTKVTGLTNGKEVSYPISVKYTEKPNVNDVIQFMLTPKGEIYIFNVRIAEKNLPAYNRFNVSMDLYVNSYSQISYVGGDRLVAEYISSSVSYKHTYINNSQTATYLIDYALASEKKVQTVNFESILSTDKIMVVQKDGILSEIFIVRGI